MFCNKCSKEIKDDSVFCNFCGNKITPEDTKNFSNNDKEESTKNKATENGKDDEIYKSCPNCGKLIKWEATICPNCNSSYPKIEFQELRGGITYPVLSGKNSQTSNYKRPLSLVLVILLGIGFFNTLIISAVSHNTLLAIIIYFPIFIIITFSLIFVNLKIKRRSLGFLISTCTMVVILIVSSIGFSIIKNKRSILKATSQNTEKTTITTVKTNGTINQEEVSKYNPNNINTFAAADEGEIIRFYFVLEDSNGQNTPGDGKANLQIKDSTSKVVYAQDFNFKASEFVNYGFQLTGKGIGKAYEWRVNKSEIEKGVSESGTADITLTMAGGKVLKSTANYVIIPKYSEEELIEVYENAYNKTAKVSGEVIKKGSFEVTLAKYGYYTHLEYGYYGDEVTDFRIDLIVKNISSKKDSFYVSEAALISGSSQYKYSYNSKIDTSDIYAGVIKEGYILFEGVPDTLPGQIKIISGIAQDSSYNQINYEFDVEN